MPRLGLVGAGKRGRLLMENLYELGDQEYFLAEREDGHPHSMYHKYGIEIPDWAEDISDLDPEITAIVDPVRAAREEATAICEANGDTPDLFETFEEFLRSGTFDAALVASPVDRHAGAVVPLLEHDVDVFCEKPLANTLEGHDRIHDAHRESNAVLYIGFQMREIPYYQKIKRLIERGAIGRLGAIHHSVVRYTFFEAQETSESGDRDAWRFDAQRSGGSLLEKTCHDFDYFNWCAEEDPVRVSAFGNQHVFGRNTDIIDQGTVSIEYEDTIASLDLCLYAGFGEQGHLAEYRGSEGVLRTPGEDETIEQFSKGEHNQFGISADGSHKGGDIAEMRRFLRCLRGEAEPPADVRDAKKADVIAFAAKRSLDEGRMVDIDSNYDMVDPST